jgi:hypothetical protein
MKPSIVILISIVIVTALILWFNVRTFLTATTGPTRDKNDSRNSIQKPPKIKNQLSASGIIFDINDKKKSENFHPIPFSTCFSNSTHFSLKPNVLKPSMKEEMIFKTKKINKATKRKIPAKHSSVEFIEEECLQEQGGTPECSMWNCFSSENENEQEEHQNENSKKQQLPSLALRKCCHEHSALKETALWVMEKLEEHEIRYFLSTGSALGAIRHNGVIIPWDTDVDLAIFPEDADKVKQIFTSFKHEHYFHPDPNGKPMYWIHHSKNGKPVDGPHVEIFFEADYTKHTESLLPLQRCDFYGKNNAWCPNVKMFEIWFGKNWKCYGGGHYHNDGRCTVYHLGKKIEKRSCKEENEKEEDCDL